MKNNLLGVILFLCLLLSGIGLVFASSTNKSNDFFEKSMRCNDHFSERRTSFKQDLGTDGNNSIIGFETFYSSNYDNCIVSYMGISKQTDNLYHPTYIIKEINNQYSLKCSPETDKNCITKRENAKKSLFK